MEIKKRFIERNIMDEWVLVPIGDAQERYNGILTMNESAHSMWLALPAATDAQDIATTIAEEYDVTVEEALEDVREFLSRLEKLNII